MDLFTTFFFTVKENVARGINATFGKQCGTAVRHLAAGLVTT